MVAKYNLAQTESNIEQKSNWMDQNTWMYEIGRASSEYIESLDEFITTAETDQLEKENTTISCPCKKCKNARWYTDSTDIKNHLLAHGFMRGYTCWSFHGKILADRNPSILDNDTDNEEDSYNSDNNVNFDDIFDDMNMEDNVVDRYHDRLQQLFVDAEIPLYTGCMNITKLFAVIKLVNLKLNNGWSNTSFTSMLEWLNKMLPEGNELSVSTYKAKKLMCPMGLEIQRIHACPNDCMLYRNKDKDLHQCKVCGTSRYKREKPTDIDSDVSKNGPPAKAQRQPRNDIDVYLQPLVDDMMELWSTEIHYKGKKACPVCEENTHSIWLTNWLLLNIPRKTKDGIKVRRDMEIMIIRPELQPKDIDGRSTKFLPPACYTMSKVEKTKLCQYDSYHNSWNSTQPYSTHNNKTMLIHSNVIDPDVLDEYQRDILLTLFELEMYFPPSFFDDMVHLVSHIVREIKACGPVFLRYMYPFEIYMGILKGYVRNLNRTEGSIVERYASEEVIEFCTNYMNGFQSFKIPQIQHEGRLSSQGTLRRKMGYSSVVDYHKAHFTVLQHSTSIDPRTLPNIDKTVEALGFALRHVIQYQEFYINGYTFYTKDQDKKSKMQNSGVTVIASSAEFTIVNREERSRITKESYNGVIQKIWELDYGSYKIPLFKYKWVDNVGGVQVDEDGFTTVNLSNDNIFDEDEYNQFDELPPFSVGVEPLNEVVVGNNTIYFREDHEEGDEVADT
ncbi:uncharacterized protein [Rutidosis leptorrhynchoides]|uniref:uncharacterized protein n=1 Tax=Rutidosis leptorrhynchoides TaxID=125765 RepID=UPI003A999002